MSIVNSAKITRRIARIHCLECMKVALRTYSRTKNKEFMEQAKWFGNQSKLLKQDVNL